MKEYERFEKAKKEEERALKELRYYEDRVKILEHKIPKLTRKERTHRLCTRGAMLEKYLKEPDILTDEDVAWYLNRVCNLTGAQRYLEIMLAGCRERLREESEDH